MAEFWGKKKEDFIAAVENDCKQTINIKKKKSETGEYVQNEKMRGVGVDVVNFIYTFSNGAH